MKKLIILILSSLVLSGCSTGYHARGLGGGYSDLKLSDDTYMITFNGNGYTSQEKVNQYGLRRCADLTKEKGYNYFVILGSSSSFKNYQYTSPVVANTNSSYTGSSYGNYAYVNGNSTTTYTGGNTTQMYKHAISITIKMFENPMPNTLDANAVLSNFENN